LGRNRRVWPNLKENADFCTFGLDQIKNMHYCAYQLNKQAQETE